MNDIEKEMLKEAEAYVKAKIDYSEAVKRESEWRYKREAIQEQMTKLSLALGKIVGNNRSNRLIRLPANEVILSIRHNEASTHPWLILFDFEGKEIR